MGELATVRIEDGLGRQPHIPRVPPFGAIRCRYRFNDDVRACTRDSGPTRGKLEEEAVEIREVRIGIVFARVSWGCAAPTTIPLWPRELFAEASCSSSWGRLTSNASLNYSQNPAIITLTATKTGNGVPTAS